MEIRTKPRRWGNSLGIIIPRSIARKQNITLDTEIVIKIEKDNPIKKVFGSAKNLKIDFQRFRDKERKKERMLEERKWKQHIS